jgi:2-keto-3-deoxy-L-rhamnonate aldolase RhmA
MSRLFERRRMGQPALGTYVQSPCAEHVETLGYCGLDFVIIDQMTTSIGWSDVAEMVRAAARFDMTPFVRLQAYPWGVDESDPRLPADIVRAQSLGCEGAFASVNLPRQVEQMLLASHDHHSRPWIRETGRQLPGERRKSSALEIPNSAAAAEGATGEESGAKSNRIVGPLIESKKGLDNLEEILSLPGLRAVHLGMGDLSREMGHHGDDTHPEMRAIIERTVHLADVYSQIVLVNVHGSMRADSLEDIAADTAWLVQHGVHAVILPKSTFAIQWVYSQIIGHFRR